MTKSGGTLTRPIRYLALIVAALLSASVVQGWATPAGANTDGNGLVVRDLTFTSQPLLHHVDGTDRLILASGSTVQIWSTAGVLLHTLTNISDVTAIASSGTTVALVAHGNGAIVILDATTGTETTRITGTTDAQSDIAIDGSSVWWVARIAGTDPALPDGKQPFEVIHFSLTNPASTTETLPAPGIFADGGTVDAIPGVPNSVIYTDNGSGDHFRLSAGGATPVASSGSSYIFAGFVSGDATSFWGLDLNGRTVKVDVSTMSPIAGTTSAKGIGAWPFSTQTDGQSTLLYNGNGPEFQLVPAADPTQRQRITLSSPGNYNASDLNATSVFTIWSKPPATSNWTGSVHKLVIANRSLATAFPFPTTTTTAPTTTTTAAPTTTTTAPTTTTTAPTTTTTAPQRTMTVRAFAHGVPADRFFVAFAGCSPPVTTHMYYNVPQTFTINPFSTCYMHRDRDATRGTYIRPGDGEAYIETYRWHSESPSNDITITVLDYFPSAFTDLQPFIFEQYEAVLGREPTEWEFNYWWSQFVDHDAAGESIATALLQSSEFTTKVRPVSRLYLAFFDRWSDRAGEQYWVDIHRGGHHLNSIADHFAASEEFALTYGALDNYGFVSLIYRNVLNRAGDTQGINYWTALLNQRKLTRGQLMVQFSESAEFRALTDAEITVRYITVAEVELEPSDAILNDRAAVYRASNGNLRLFVAELLSSQAYHDKFIWRGNLGALAGQTTELGANTSPPTELLPDLDLPTLDLPTLYDGAECSACLVIERD